MQQAFSSPHGPGQVPNPRGTSSLRRHCRRYQKRCPSPTLGYLSARREPRSEARQHVKEPAHGSSNEVRSKRGDGRGRRRAGLADGDNPMNQQPTVADYIVRRLAREGITDCFGVAGDFAFKLNDAIARSEAIRWIGCSNELDAAYAADGYARVRGCSMLCTTYAVGELSALNGVMGAKAERSCVFHLVGMPTMRKQRVRQIVHHTLGDGEFQNFANISAQAACVSAVITPDNCAHEMERLIATARAESRPAYILVAADYAVTPVTGSAPTPYPKPASGPDLAKAVAAIAERIRGRSIGCRPSRIHGLAVQAPGQPPGIDRDSGLPIRRHGNGQGRPVRDTSAVRRDVYGWRLVPRRP